MQPSAMPRVEPVGDDVGGFAPAKHAGNRLDRVSVRSGRNYRLVQGCFTARGIEAHPSQHTVVVAWPWTPSHFAALAVESQPVPSTKQHAITDGPGGEIGSQVGAPCGTDP